MTREWPASVERVAQHLRETGAESAIEEFLSDTPTADEVNVAWWALSRACHHLSYELPPTAAELRALIDIVDRFVEAS